MRLNIQMHHDQNIHHNRTLTHTSVTSLGSQATASTAISSEQLGIGRWLPPFLIFALASN